MAAIVALHRRLKSRFVAPKLQGGKGFSTRLENSDNNAGAAIDEEFEDSNSLLGVMPTPSDAIIHGLLQKIDFRGEWSLRQGTRIAVISQIL
jgi:hypothetical protein